MTATRIFLGLSALAWLPYAIYCLFRPDMLETAAGLAAQSQTAATEVRAMYGGLQAGIGALCAAAVFRAELVRPALVMLAFLGCGLATARLVGVALDGGLSAYTGGALLFEIILSAVAIGLLLRGAEARMAS